MLLVILELVTGLLFPLFMGIAINDLIDGHYHGIVMLIILTIASLTIGILRRFYDSRVYGKIYRKMASDLVQEEQEAGSNVSTISARVNLLTEIVEFFENNFPEIVNNFLGLIGVVIIIMTLSFNISILCFGVTLFIIIVYGLSSKKHYVLNKRYNNLLETQVTKLQTKEPKVIDQYFKNIMDTNIKLSDLETLNYGAILTVALSVFIYSIYVATSGDNITYGAVFALLMYVYEFIERVTTLPLYYQNYIRLKEISSRLSRIN